MRILKTGDVFRGNNHADMINRAIGTHFSAYMKSSVDLSLFGNDDVIAWFVFMDGTVHGTEENYVWQNILSTDGNCIREYSVGRSQEKVISKRQKEGFLPFRLAFQLDPYCTGDRYCCKFVGAFCFSAFLREDLTAIEYKKASDVFKLGEKGESNKRLDGRELFIPHMPKYDYPIKNMGFSGDVYLLLKEAKYTCAGELLEIGFESGERLIKIIQDKLYEVFGKTVENAKEELSRITTDRGWELFNEVLMENGEPFYLQKTGDSLCIAKRESGGSTEIFLDTEKGTIFVGDGKSGDWKEFSFDPFDAESFLACAEKAAIEADGHLATSGMICRGDIFNARTNAELLNILLKKNMKGYMKCIYWLTDTYALLMHTFDWITAAGWLNRELEDGTVVEQYVGTRAKKFESHNGLPDDKFRALFEKDKDAGRFIFKGVYKLSGESSPDRRVWIMVSNKTNLHDF